VVSAVGEVSAVGGGREGGSRGAGERRPLCQARCAANESFRSVRQLAVPARLGGTCTGRFFTAVEDFIVPEIVCLPACSIPDPGSGALPVPCRALDYVCIYIYTYTHIHMPCHIMQRAIRLSTNVYTYICICIHTSISVLTLLWRVALACCTPCLLSPYPGCGSWHCWHFLFFFLVSS